MARQSRVDFSSPSLPVDPESRIVAAANVQSAGRLQALTLCLDMPAIESQHALQTGEEHLDFPAILLLHRTLGRSRKFPHLISG
jgi:hypothetical protein